MSSYNDRKKNKQNGDGAQQQHPFGKEIMEKAIVYATQYLYCKSQDPPVKFRSPETPAEAMAVDFLIKKAKDDAATKQKLDSDTDRPEGQGEVPPDDSVSE